MASALLTSKQASVAHVEENPTSIPAEKNPVVLRIDNIRKSYGDLEVLKGISFDIHQHEVVALLGPSGSGKSTLMRCVNLLEQVNDGQIWLGDTDITDPAIKQDDIRAMNSATKPVI